MAVKTSLLLLIWTSILPTVSATYDTHLPSQVLASIPECAQVCVSAFIQVNFPACGTSPSMQCLCSQQTQSGFTIGEGAVQCIVGSDKVGACKSGEVDGKFNDSGIT